MIYFYSDPHFFHENIIRLADRPFSSEEDMNHSLVNSYNAVVNCNDEVYFLGDIAFNRKKIKNGLLDAKKVNNILKKLNGRKYLIEGNHDDWFLKDPLFTRSIFQWIKTRHVLEYNGRSIILIHDPAPYLPDPETGALPVEKLNENEILIYGHVHGDFVVDIPQPSKCVCVEQTDYRPVSLDDVFAALGLQI